MATDPSFAATPRNRRGLLTEANPARDGSGTLVDIATAEGEGLKIDEIVVQAIVTTTAGMVRLFIYDDVSNTVRLFDEVDVDAVTVAASTPAFRAVRYYDNLALEPGQALRASTHNAEGFVVHALGGQA